MIKKVLLVLIISINQMDARELALMGSNSRFVRRGLLDPELGIVDPLDLSATIVAAPGSDPSGDGTSNAFDKLLEEHRANISNNPDNYEVKNGQVTVVLNEMKINNQVKTTYGIFDVTADGNVSKGTISTVDPGQTKISVGNDLAQIVELDNSFVGDKDGDGTTDSEIQKLLKAKQLDIINNPDKYEVVDGQIKVALLEGKVNNIAYTAYGVYNVTNGTVSEGIAVIPEAMKISDVREPLKPMGNLITTHGNSGSPDDIDDILGFVMGLIGSFFGAHD